MNGNLIGVIGQDDNNNIICRGIDKKHEGLIKSFIGIISVDLAVIENNVSVSTTKIIQPNDKQWIVYMQYQLPFNYYTSAINSVDNEKFNKIKLNT